MPNYCTEAPESIEGYYLCANRFKVHGMAFGINGVARQYFYYDEVIDNLISEYEYKKGEGNKAKLTYHVKYRINPNKVILFTGNTNAGIDITFDLQGELDLTFYCYRTDTDHYIGEFNGKVISQVTNNRTGAVSNSEITGLKYFALERIEEE